MKRKRPCCKEKLDKLKKKRKAKLENAKKKKAEKDLPPTLS